MIYKNRHGIPSRNIDDYSNPMLYSTSVIILFDYLLLSQRVHTDSGTAELLALRVHNNIYLVLIHGGAVHHMIYIYKAIAYHEYLGASRV